jgi:adenylyltransferase/sulfurtransferase
MTEVVIPGVLAAVTGGRRRFTVEGGTVVDVIEGLLRDHPELRVHLFDEQGAWRPHVRCFDDQGRVDHRMSDPAAGRLTILQAVSGGRR